MKEEKTYYKGLDIIRLLSCLLVFLYHLNFIKGGFLAVCVFFTLSGYLSTMSALKKNRFSVKEYYLSRIKKIYLPLLIVVFITIILSKFVFTSDWINLKPESTSVIFGYNNYWQISANMDYFTRHINSPFIHMWYIAILLQFELAFPLLFMLLRFLDKKINNNISIFLTTLLTILSTAYFIYLSSSKDMAIIYYDTFARSFSILFGIWLALIHYKYDIKIARITKKLSPVIFYSYLILLSIICYYASYEMPNIAIAMVLATVIGLRIIEYATLNHSSKSKIISTLTKYTYEIYLVQYPIIFFMQNYTYENKLPITIMVTVLASCLLHFVTNYNNKLKILKAISIVATIIILSFGTHILIQEKDHTEEMKELEERLNNNFIMIEEKNEEYKIAIQNEKEEWNKMLSNYESGEVSIKEIVRNLPVVGVGDSVLLAAVKGLYNNFPNGYFDGKVSRTLVGGKEVLTNLQNEGKLGDVVIVALVNNGDYIPKRNKEFLEFLEDKDVYWINAVKADDLTFNDKFKEFAKDYPNVHIVDWEEASKDHPEYFYADGIHVKGDGIQAYADLVYNTICDVYTERYREQNKELFIKHEEEINSKIAFYGNDVLTNMYEYLNEDFEKASINVMEEFDFDKMYEEIKEKNDEEILEHNIVLMFDKNANMDKTKYEKIADICENCELFICDISGNKYDFEDKNVHIIDFYQNLLENSDYLMPDRVHLSPKGNQKLVEKLLNIMAKKA